MEVYHPGTIIRNGRFELCVEQPLSQGQMAHSYRAKDLSSRNTVLFKSYVEPLPDRTHYPWFNKYVDHQEEIRKRLEAIPDQAIRILGHFNHNGAYHQVIEWARGRSLERLLEEQFDNATSLENHLHLAKV